MTETPTIADVIAALDDPAYRIVMIAPGEFVLFPPSETGAHVEGRAAEAASARDADACPAAVSRVAAE